MRSATSLTTPDASSPSSSPTARHSKRSRRRRSRPLVASFQRLSSGLGLRRLSVVAVPRSPSHSRRHTKIPPAWMMPDHPTSDALSVFREEVVRLIDAAGKLARRCGGRPSRPSSDCSMYPDAWREALRLDRDGVLVVRNSKSGSRADPCTLEHRRCASRLCQVQRQALPASRLHLLLRLAMTGNHVRALPSRSTLRTWRRHPVSLPLEQR